MRIYQNCAEMYGEEKRNLAEMGLVVHPQTMQDKRVAGDPAFRTLEMSPAVFTISDGSDRDAWLESLGKSLDWAKQDFSERIAVLDLEKPVNPGEAWKLREGVWREFLHDGRFAYTYSERLGLNVNSLRGIGNGNRPLLLHVVNELHQNPDTRQAILPIFNSLIDSQNMGGKARIPCSLHYQLMRRAGKLKMMYVMRSCDFVEHFPYDIWMALELQQAIADTLGIETGDFTYFAGSLHMYQKDAEGVF